MADPLRNEIQPTLDNLYKKWIKKKKDEKQENFKEYPKNYNN